MRRAAPRRTKIGALPPSPLQGEGLGMRVAHGPPTYSKGINLGHTGYTGYTGYNNAMKTSLKWPV